ncbi:hypothetical protein LOZ80_11010 [Paenibacillus sp. HWE-109]|uniref:hypothetical protein n=1 Tax=Paenibacillus sp. HWE-109 TaxID=1306526 RepID=UPI001EDFDFFD|nr:hypothetical protein [Paenibacillus sp. HWE-109]UKS29424.1 hypothetical protein LOZ80_11010 [Paenibacillus sp. HWE-109]
MFYNTEQNKTLPLSNWWGLTTPEWKNRVLMVDPLQSPAQMDMFVAFVANSDDMAKAYKEKFGIVLNGTKNAGWQGKPTVKGKERCHLVKLGLG